MTKLGRVFARTLLAICFTSVALSPVIADEAEGLRIATERKARNSG